MGHRLAIATIAAAACIALAVIPAAQAADLTRLVAPPSACPHQTDLQDPSGVQERAMLCMTNFARERTGLSRFAESGLLDLSASHKSADILRCNSFSHEACGREFTFWMQRFGYLSSSCGAAGENIAWGSGEYGTVRSMFISWIRSPGHRENILGRYRQIGIGLRTGGLEGFSDAHVWTQDFGNPC